MLFHLLIFPVRDQYLPQMCRIWHYNAFKTRRLYMRKGQTQCP